MLKFSFPGPQSVSFHNHTCWSDGSASPEDLCRAGKKSGLREFGVSDHWVIPPEENFPAIDWRMDPSRLDAYVETLLRMKKELDDGSFTLRLGL